MANEITVLADRLKAEILRIQMGEIGTISQAYNNAVFRPTEGDREALLAFYEENGTVKGSKQLKRLATNTAGLLGSFGAFMEIASLDSANVGIAAGIDSSTRIIETSAAAYGAEGVTVVSVPENVIQALVDFMAPGSELFGRIQQLAPVNTANIIEGIIDGAAAGMNPAQLGAQMSKLYGLPLTDALRITRTVQMYSYREAARVNRVANGEIVTGWVWYAEIGDPRTCMSCINMHGTVHSNDETLNDHHNGRCTAIDMLFGINPVTETGEEWFNTIPENEQVTRMGQAKHTAWVGGEFEFGQLTAQRNDPVYGEMRFADSLKGILGN